METQYKPNLVQKIRDNVYASGVATGVVICSMPSIWQDISSGKCNHPISYVAMGLGILGANLFDYKAGKLEKKLCGKPEENQAKVNTSIAG